MEQEQEQDGPEEKIGLQDVPARGGQAVGDAQLVAGQGEAGREQGVWSAAEAAGLVALIRSVAPKPGLRQRADWLGKLARKFSRLTGLGHGRKADYWLDRSWDF